MAEKEKQAIVYIKVRKLRTDALSFLTSFVLFAILRIFP